jgi:quercetin dioxygenase-like cupin family protein
MHRVSKIDELAAHTPTLYEPHSKGFRRASYVDRSMGSVHMGAGVCYLAPGGEVQPHFHSFEESFYILEGHVTLQIGVKSHTLEPGHYGLIPTGVHHAWRNTWTNPSDPPAKWLEMQAPQPRLPEDSRDTFFIHGHSVAAHEGDTHGGRFDEEFSPTTGVAIKMFVDRSFGAIHQSLFLTQYMPGAKIDPHDHAFEESHLIISGHVRATADGKTYDLGPGDAIWTGVGCIHSFENVGSEPVRWIETQAPLPPAKEAFRFERDWPGEY